MRLLLCAIALVPLLAAQEAPPQRTAHENLDAVLWMQTSIEYSAVTREIYGNAKRMLDTALKHKHWTAAIEQTGNFRKLPPAIILDLDETAVDNSRFYARSIERNVPFIPSDWNRWVAEANASAIPGAVEFTQYAAKKGVAVFYVSNRDNDLKEPTRRNLAALGFPLSEKEDRLLFLKGRPEWEADKTTRRAEIAKKYRILLLFGDDLGDFLPGARAPLEQRVRLMQSYQQYWGERWIILPNPVYGSWETALYPNAQRMPDRESLQQKYNSLRK